MGCDAHMYVEYKRKDRNGDSYLSFGGRINPGRNYWIFGLMSKGVRCEFPNSLEPKGMPEFPSYHSLNDNRMYISEDGKGDDECTLEQAKSWGVKITYNNEKPTWAEQPDWHSHTWLTLEEYEKVINDYNTMAPDRPEPEYEALLAAMKRLSEFDYDVRVVVWFDN